MFIASLFALTETDSKKIVALSTLRQLGVIFTRLGLGNKLQCFMHMINHAFAKANLFMVIGSVLHQHFSKQDHRDLSINIPKVLTLTIWVSLYSLIGVFLSRGFFSKEIILLRASTLINGLLHSLLIMGLVALTVAYCLKLMSLITNKSRAINCEEEIGSNPWMTLPLLLLGALRLMRGVVNAYNFYFTATVEGFIGLMWMGVVTGLLFLLLPGLILLGFHLLTRLNSQYSLSLFGLGKLSSRWEKLIERFYVGISYIQFIHSYKVIIGLMATLLVIIIL